MIEEALYTRLTGYAGLAALIGARVYPDKAPQDATYPLVVYQRVSGPRVHSHQGFSNLAYPRFQFTAWADDFKEVRELAAQVKLALDGYAGTVGSETIYAILIGNELDIFNNATNRNGALIDAVVWHKE